MWYYLRMWFCRFAKSKNQGFLNDYLHVIHMTFNHVINTSNLGFMAKQKTTRLGWFLFYSWCRARIYYGFCCFFKSQPYQRCLCTAACVNSCGNTIFAQWMCKKRPSTSTTRLRAVGGHLSRWKFWHTSSLLFTFAFGLFHRRCQQPLRHSLLLTSSPGSSRRLCYRLRISVGRKHITVNYGVSALNLGFKAKQKTTPIGWFLFYSWCRARTSDIMINSHALYRLS